MQKTMAKLGTIYIPKEKQDERIVERLHVLAKSRDRSVNYLVIEAIVQFLDRHEKTEKSSK